MMAFFLLAPLAVEGFMGMDAGFQDATNFFGIGILTKWKTESERPARTPTGPELLVPPQNECGLEHAVYIKEMKVCYDCYNLYKDFDIFEFCRDQVCSIPPHNKECMYDICRVATKSDISSLPNEHLQCGAKIQKLFPSSTTLDRLI